MIKIGLVLVSLGIVCVIALWAKSPAITGAPTAQSISIEELHRVADHKNMPTQELEDHTFIFPTVRHQTQ
jgi:hypothetical protein